MRPLTLLGVNGFHAVLEGDKFSMGPGPEWVMVVFGGYCVIVSSSSVNSVLRGTWIRAFGRVCSMREPWLSVWLEKNNEGWGP